MPHVVRNTQQVEGGLLLNMALLQWKFSQLLEMALKHCEVRFSSYLPSTVQQRLGFLHQSTVEKAAHLWSGVTQKQQKLLLLFLNFAIGGGSHGN